MLFASGILQVLSLKALCILIKELLSVEDESLHRIETAAKIDTSYNYRKHCSQLRTFPSESDIKSTEQGCNLMSQFTLALIKGHIPSEHKGHHRTMYSCCHTQLINTCQSFWSNC